jgi:hypothetical protein
MVVVVVVAVVATAAGYCLYRSVDTFLFFAGMVLVSSF